MSHQALAGAPIARRHPRRLGALPPAAIGVAWLVVAGAAWGQRVPEYELPPIRYSDSAPSNAVSALQARIVAGTFNLAATDPRETLRRLLEALAVPVESQVLVFSKTSLQRAWIGPTRPRAVYFGTDAYVGWVPGGLIEIAVTDPQLGLAFYRLDPRQPAATVQFERDADCLSCHAGSLTRGWPGLMVRSVFPDARGEPIASAGSFLTGHDSPLAERWGGWYVTGLHGTARHLGNALATDPGRNPPLDLDPGANRRDLAPFFPTGDYLRADSDLVALMVLEHQYGLHNRLVQAALRTRYWLHYQEQLQRELGEPASLEPTGTARRVLETETERILEPLLFCGEIALPEGGLEGAGDFQRAFRTGAPTDTHGRSLMDFDLRTRLFRLRCSYMIHARTFDALPEPLKSRVYRRLHAILVAPQPPPKFAHLPAEERATILHLLRATKPDFARAIAPSDASTAPTPLAPSPLAPGSRAGGIEPD